jgi:hypothetical protein
MNTIELIRDASARRAMLHQYAQAHERLSELEQREIARNPHAADYTHELALRVLRAYLAETDDPEPAL